MVFTDMLVCLDSYPDASSTTAVDQCARLAAALGEGVCAVAAHVRIPLKSNLIANLLLDLSDVARTKWNSGAAIDDPVRERELLQDLVVDGEKLGLDVGRVRVFFDAQFAAARRLQTDLHAEWRAQH
ncbi:MAG: hypothetical protein EON94_03610, partial [Caulobacteraceae bacterium]